MRFPGIPWSHIFVPPEPPGAARNLVVPGDFGGQKGSLIVFQEIADITLSRSRMFFNVPGLFWAVLARSGLYCVVNLKSPWNSPYLLNLYSVCRKKNNLNMKMCYMQPLKLCLRLSNMTMINQNVFDYIRKDVS